MLKLALNTDWNFQDISAKLVEVHSRGVDHNWLQKVASSEDRDHFRDIEPVPGHQLIHLLAVGDTETYGYNRNADGFSADDNRKNHDCFTKKAYLYRNHKNKKDLGDPTFGRPVKSWHSDPMGRIELIVAANEKTAGDMIHAIANGDDVAFSMGCLTDPEYPILTKEGYKPIASIMPGDLVYTGEGNWKPVLNVQKKPYSGDLITLGVNGLPFPLEITADHPMYAKVFEGSRAAAAIGAKARRFCESESPSGDWTSADQIGVGDLLFYRPVLHNSSYASLESVDLALLLGYYLAEGSIAFCRDLPNTVRLHCNYADSLPRAIPQIINRIRPETTVGLNTLSNTNTGLTVIVYSAELSQFCMKYVGSGVRNKRIPPEVFNGTEDVREAFISAWLDGDGWVDQKGVHWSTCSIPLALSLRDLLASLRIPSSIYKINHQDGTTEYTVNVSHCESHRFAEWSEKAAGLPPVERTKTSCMREVGDLYAYRVKSTEVRKVEGITVYNMEVADDHSYSAAGLISHNCDVAVDVCNIRGCGNIAKNPGEYCGHSKKGSLGRILEDGQFCGRDNPNPQYFDISKVYRPAERTAYSIRLVKSAQAYREHLDEHDNVLGGAEMAKKAGVVVPEHIVDTSARPLSKWAALQALASMEKEMPMQITKITVMGTDDLPDEAIEAGNDEACKHGGLKNVMEELHGRGILLKPRQLFRMVLGDENVEQVVDPLEGEIKTALDSVFSEALSLGGSDLVNDSRFDGGDSATIASARFRDLLDQSKVACSIDPDATELRVMRRAIAPETSNLIIPGNKLAYAPGAAAKGFADLYATYALAFCAHSHNSHSSLAKTAVTMTNYQESHNER